MGLLPLIKRSIGMRRSQSIATLASVALAAAVLFALSTLSLGVQGGLDKSRERLGADLLVIPAEAAVNLDERALLFTGAPVNMYMDAHLIEDISSVEGVERVSGQFYGQTLNASCCSSSEAARLLGFDEQSDWVVMPWLDGQLDTQLSETQIITGSNLSGDFASGKGRVLGHIVERVAILDPTGTDLDGSILMDIDVVRDFVRDTPELAPLWERYGDPSDLLSCIMVDVADDKQDSVVAAFANIPNIALIQGSKAIENVASQLETVFAIMAGAALLLVIAMLFQLLTRFFSLVWERRGELALYRALGASKRELAYLIGGEAAVLIGGGLIIGLILGAVFEAVLPGFIARAGAFPFLAPSLLQSLLCALGVAALFFLVGCIAISVPLVRANRIDPSAAIQTGDID